MAGLIALLGSLITVGSGIKCSIEDDKLAQNIRVHELSGARYYYDRKGQAHLADTGSKINFTNKGVEYVEGGFYYNYELERQKRELAEIEEKLKLFNDTYPDCPFTIGGTKDNLGFITYAAYDKENGEQIHHISAEDILGELDYGRKTFYGCVFKKAYGWCDGTSYYDEVEISGNEYLRLRENLLMLQKALKKIDLNTPQYDCIINYWYKNDVFNLGIRENEYKHRRWNEEMKKKCGKDYLDKVWTEEWQRENLSLKDYYSGVEITNPEKKDDTIRWV